VFESVQLAIETGVAGLSIEDYDGHQFFTTAEAVERIQAAREAIEHSAQPVVLVARSEGYIRNNPVLGETIERLLAYKTAGADCLYAPGVKDVAEMGRIVSCVAPTPVNALLLPGLSVSELAACGVRRVSVGGALARIAAAAFHAAATSFLEKGTLQ
jgi:2-methylisocitrate lyase-like PEP mutase family enzyme